MATWGLCSSVLCLPLSGPGAPQKIPRNLQKREGTTGGLGHPAAPSFQFFTRFSLGTLRDTELRLYCVTRQKPVASARSWAAQAPRKKSPEA